MPVLAMIIAPAAAMAEGVKIEDAMVPLAPPGMMAHAAYRKLTNAGDATCQLIGVKAEGYKTAHLHQSANAGGVATISVVDQIEIAPGQSVAFEHGGLHIMLMHPVDVAKESDIVNLTLLFADGEALSTPAKVMHLHHDES
nr:copper chaperone PCu(A)C [Actibacterium sp. 188UL27-1]